LKKKKKEGAMLLYGNRFRGLILDVFTLVKDFDIDKFMY
jgi:hypothetical protein